MAKVVVLSCEVCGAFDSEENRVVTVGVCGHRVELCKKERIRFLVQTGVTEEQAAAYCDVYDQRDGVKGPNPSMAQVLEMLAEGLGATEEPPAAAEPAQEPLPEAAGQEETGEAVPASKRKR